MDVELVEMSLHNGGQVPWRNATNSMYTHPSTFGGYPVLGGRSTSPKI